MGKAAARLEGLTERNLSSALVTTTSNTEVHFWDTQAVSTHLTRNKLKQGRGVEAAWCIQRNTTSATEGRIETLFIRQVVVAVTLHFLPSKNSKRIEIFQLAANEIVLQQSYSNY
jgi:hypothetical protein